MKKRKKQKVTALVAAAVFLLLLVLLLVFLAGRSRKSGYQPGMPPPGPPYVVALDAGHGGKDLGATGLVNEVEMTERTVDFLYTMLSEDPNYNPVLTRKAGAGASVAERARKANASGASLLLSVHGNSDATGEARGFECFPAPPGRTWHQESMAFAQSVAAHMASAGSRLRGQGGIRYAYYEGNDGESQKVFREISDNTVYEQPSFGVVEKPGCPAVLAEQCFITNAEDVEMFASEQGCYVSAQAYYHAICDYYKTEPLL